MSGNPEACAYRHPRLAAPYRRPANTSSLPTLTGILDPSQGSSALAGILGPARAARYLHRGWIGDRAQTHSDVELWRRPPRGS